MEDKKDLSAHFQLMVYKIPRQDNFILMREITSRFGLTTLTQNMR